MIWKVIFSATLCFISVGTLPLNGTADEPIIELPNGKIQGRTARSLADKSYYVFEGVPYAEPPIGELRYREPVPVSNWTGVLQTQNITKICLQQIKIRANDPRETEDCLYLHVYVPEHSKFSKDVDGNPALLPVHIYIIGGQYRFGNPAGLNFQFLVDEGVICIIPNFRHGALGWLSTEDGTFPANIALKDQNLAMRWVRDNVQYFGGDPKKVTIGGQSSGAGCVSFHVLSPKAKGLFRGAIIQSANGIGASHIQLKPRYYAFELGKKLSPDFTSANSSIDLRNLLMRKSAKEIMQTDIDIPQWANNTLVASVMILAWKPSIEDPKIDKDPYVTAPLVEKLRNGQFNNITILTGIADEELADASDDTAKYLPYVENDLKIIGHRAINVREENKLAYAREIKALYSTAPFKENITDLASKYTDVYFYQFTYDGPMGYYHTYSKIDGLSPVAHAHDICYLYLHAAPPDYVERFPPRDFVMARKLARMWANFIAYLNPIPEKDGGYLNIDWPKWKPDHLVYVEINTNLSLREDPRQYRAWRTIMDKYYEHPATIF